MSYYYYCTKNVVARPMTRLEYNEYRGWDLPADENGADEGYLVEDVEGVEINHPDHAGYISWSPRNVFEAAYQPITDMDFGHALRALKEGHRVARKGWNGKGMWIAFTPGSTFDARHAKPGHAAAHRAAELQADLPHDGTENVIDLCPHIDMRAADGSMVIGWLASQTDMLAEDWHIVRGGT